jgi:hypothetical protein
MLDKLLVDKDCIALNGLSYIDYYQKIQNFASEKTTSGHDLTAERIEITKLNLHRMKRINDAQTESQIYELPFPIGAAILTEAWCGDSAQNIPWLEHFFNSCNPKIQSYYFFRDDNPELMNQFLTNGSRSIPKCIFYNLSNGQVLDTWGARPEEIMIWLASFRAQNPEISKHDWEIALHKYYTQNKGAAIMNDLSKIIGGLI